MAYVPKQGDLVWLTFTPQSGHEQIGRRPALVISNDIFNRETGLAMVCPVTSTKRPYPLHVELTATRQVQGFVMIEQVKSVDYAARNAELIERASDELLLEVLARLRACL